MSELMELFPTNGKLTKIGWELPANITKEQWKEFGSRFSELNGAVQWAWGDWWNSGNFEHGERKALVESDEWNGLAYQTLKDYGTVCGKFQRSTRGDLLSFKHYKECISLPLEEALKVLDWAVENKASTRKTAEKVKQVKSWLAQGWTSDQLERKKLLESGIAVVANKRTDENGKQQDAALIAWADQKGIMEEIGRSTKWGNPFELPADGTRDEVCDNYEKNYFPYKKSLHKSVKGLKGKLLVCWCYPERCHGDHIKEVANES